MRTLAPGVVALAFAFTFGATGCRFRAPSVAEQERLITSGAFPGGVPAWVSPAARGEVPAGRLSSGFVPESFSARPPRSSSLAFNTGSVSQPYFEQAPLEVARLRREQAQQAAQQEHEEDSPLERITRRCPQVEDSVAEALTTTDRTKRIAMYESLTKRCPNSADLWTWLGKDYSRDGNLVKAANSLERALILDSSNEEARSLLATVRSELATRKAPGNQPPPPKL